jgi:hypothetical protein
MDPNLVAFATDVWHRSRDGVTAVWRRFRPAEAAAVEHELDTTRALVQAAESDTTPATTTEATAAQAEAWRLRLLSLLAEHPEAAQQLATALQHAPNPPTPPPTTTITMTAHAHDNTRVYQAGHDQHFTEN